METSIYFFTGTGNSLKIAKLLSEELGNCELIPIAKVWQIEKVSSISRNIGFVFPLYYFGLPKIVYEFIEKLIPDKSDYFFAVVTSAEDKNELPFQQINNILKLKGKKLSSGFTINMPNNYIMGYDVSSETHKKKVFDDIPYQIQSFIEIVKEKNENLVKESFEKEKEREKKVNSSFHTEVNEMDKSFYTTDNCNSCGICEKVCPVNNIKLINEKPKWHHKCQLCLACMHFCPEVAIQFGSDTLEAGRYHHPEISIQEIINQKL
ncbi:MAG: EFR1 family ferrodoxin [Promethearchaeota archaeon]